ncbi:MAG: cytochrome C oxidase subunit IV family protein [Ferruginibacter sp.]|nr:cytochrome C oxidase subunit IV family protein [Ferruginibacter sp.]
MEHTLTAENTHSHGHNEGTGRIWKVFWILSALTIIELALGYFLYFKGEGMGHAGILTTKLAIAALTLLKAYYIVSVFMHLGDENRNMIMTICVPLVLFVWFIIAFLWDGGSWKEMRNTNAGSKPSIENVQPAPVKHDSKP